MGPMTATYCPKLLTGRDLRYAVTWLMVEHGPLTVRRMNELLATDGFDLGGREAKIVSDALRWEIARGRVVRTGWGRYSLGVIPPTTRRRIRLRVEFLRGCNSPNP